MKKIVKLSDDGFIRATEIRNLLSEGWKISLVDDDPREIYVEKDNLSEDTASKPQLLLD